MPERGAERVAFLIGRGSRLPNILDKLLYPGSGVEVCLVISHKKVPEGQADLIGIAHAKKLGIATAVWNMHQMHAQTVRASGPVDLNGDYRPSYMKALGAFVTQPYYQPHLIVLTGWDLILDENFLNFCQNRPDRIPVLNVHPHPLPDVGQPQDTIVAPDGTTVPVLRGTEVWVRAVEQKIGWSGVTIHQIIPREYDVGPVVEREWVKIEPTDTADTLRAKLNEVEDRIVPETLLSITTGKITL